MWCTCTCFVFVSWRRKWIVAVTCVNRTCVGALTQHVMSWLNSGTNAVLVLISATPSHPSPLVSCQQCLLLLTYTVFSQLRNDVMCWIVSLCWSPLCLILSLWLCVCPQKQENCYYFFVPGQNLDIFRVMIDRLGVYKTLELDFWFSPPNPTNPTLNMV